MRFQQLRRSNELTAATDCKNYRIPSTLFPRNVRTVLRSTFRHVPGTSEADANGHTMMQSLVPKAIQKSVRLKILSYQRYGKSGGGIYFGCAICNNHIVRLVHRNHIIRTCLMYHAACKVEFQPFKRSYSQLTFFNFF